VDVAAAEVEVAVPGLEAVALLILAAVIPQLSTRRHHNSAT
jgi:hypothetical protein